MGVYRPFGGGSPCPLSSGPWGNTDVPSQLQMSDDTDLPGDLTVLLIEPQRFLSRIMCSALINAGVFTDNITEVSSATKALDLLKTKAFDVILTEMDLPDTDGEYVIRKAREWGVDSPIVVITSGATEGKVREAVNAGVNDFLVKPVSQILVSKRIARQLHHPQVPDLNRHASTLSGFSLQRHAS